MGSRLRRSVLIWPDRSGWRDCLLLGLAFAVAALPLAHEAGLLTRFSPPEPRVALALALRILVVPVLLEEAVFRAAMNPHPQEPAAAGRIWLSAIASLGLYVALHPLAGLWRPAAATVFRDPHFLLLALLLGVTCLTAYRRTGSLWPAVAIHWLTVAGWLALGGRELLAG